MATAGAGGGELCKLEASVPTGLEVGASEEYAEVFGRAPETSRGRLIFTLRALDELVAVSQFANFFPICQTPHW